MHNENEEVADDLLLLFFMNFLMFVDLGIILFPLVGPLYFIKMQGSTQGLLSASTICTRLK